LIKKSSDVDKTLERGEKKGRIEKLNQ